MSSDILSSLTFPQIEPSHQPDIDYNSAICFCITEMDPICGWPTVSPCIFHCKVGPGLTFQEASLCSEHIWIPKPYFLHPWLKQCLLEYDDGVDVITPLPVFCYPDCAPEPSIWIPLRRWFNVMTFNHTIDIAERILNLRLVREMYVLLMQRLFGRLLLPQDIALEIVCMAKEMSFVICKKRKRYERDL